eukprot:SAG31_NODE_1980_length_6748_cov_2.881336_1_plen_49_part_10
MSFTEDIILSLLSAARPPAAVLFAWSQAFVSSTKEFKVGTMATAYNPRR